MNPHSLTVATPLIQTLSELINPAGFLELLWRFILNTSVILILVRVLYYPATRRKDYLFTYILIATIVFLLCYMLESVTLQIGFALGLFAIFGIIRYRTNQIPIKEMTYLFIIIGISVINALANSKSSIAEVLFSNLAIILITFGLEKVWLLKHESSKRIIYEKIDLVKPEHYDELMMDIKERTGISKINRIETGKIDFLKNSCEIIIYYVTPEPSAGQDLFTENNDNDDD
jgi:hypothetical protein